MAENFDEMDKELMERMKGLRSQPVPANIRKGFAESVQARILQQNRKMTWFVWGIAAPAAAVLFAGLAFILFLPSGQKNKTVSVAEKPPVATSAAAVAPQSATEVSVPESADVTDDIEILRELGVWTEADEELIGITVENSLADLELEIGQDTSPVVTRTNPQLP